MNTLRPIIQGKANTHPLRTLTLIASAPFQCLQNEALILPTRDQALPAFAAELPSMLRLALPGASIPGYTRAQTHPFLRASIRSRLAGPVCASNSCLSPEPRRLSFRGAF